MKDLKFAFKLKHSKAPSYHHDNKSHSIDIIIKCESATSVTVIRQTRFDIDVILTNKSNTCGVADLVLLGLGGYSLIFPY